MSYTFAGLPLHILLVHAVVVLVPLTALAVLLHAFWPAAARRLGVVTPLGGLVVLVLTPITINAGMALKNLVGVTPAIQRHADLGPTLLPWAIALFIVALAEWGWTRFGRPRATRMPGRARIIIVLVLAAAATVVAIGSVVDVILIGDAGARAVWGGLVP
ncbi:MAG: hypothetical protein ACRET2_18230 [Steroidobacteraceae bacterium]